MFKWFKSVNSTDLFLFYYETELWNKLSINFKDYFLMTENKLITEIVTYLYNPYVQHDVKTIFSFISLLKPHSIKMIEQRT